MDKSSDHSPVHSPAVDRPVSARPPADSAVAASAVSWAAIFAGAIAGAALSLILFILGVGLGLMTVSPWSGEGIDAGTFGISAILWLTFTSLAASALGGYLAGRLRTKWVAVHADEVYFRDTAHGFLAWAFSILVTATLLSSLMAAMVAGGVRAGSAVVSGVTGTAAQVTGGAGIAAAVLGADSMGSEGASEAGDTIDYFLDSLFRRDSGAASEGDSAGESSSGSQTADTRDQADDVQDMTAPVMEVARILGRALTSDEPREEDLEYVGQLVANYTGISAEEAETRVEETLESMRTELREWEATARKTADDVRAAGAFMSMWFFIALLSGAFVGSFSATLGGKQRDA